MALAHELRELRCLVAPLAIVPPQSFMVRAQLAHVLRDAGGGRDSETCTAAPPPPAVVFVLGIDGAFVFLWFGCWRRGGMEMTPL